MMNREELFVRLNGVFRDVFDNDDITVNDSTNAKDIPGWDSLMNITLISELEEAFDIQFDMKNITNMKNVGEIADLILENLK